MKKAIELLGPNAEGLTVHY